MRQANKVNTYGVVAGETVRSICSAASENSSFDVLGSLVLVGQGVLFGVEKEYSLEATRVIGEAGASSKLKVVVCGIVSHEVALEWADEALKVRIVDEHRRLGNRICGRREKRADDVHVVVRH